MVNGSRLKVFGGRANLPLTDKIARECDFHCSSYKDRCLRRRIAVRGVEIGAGLALASDVQIAAI